MLVTGFFVLPNGQVAVMIESKPRKKQHDSASKKSPKSKRQAYPQTALANALTECAAEADRDNKLSLRDVSKLRGVPLNTLHRHLKGISKSSRIGRKPLLGIDIEDRISKNMLAGMTDVSA